MFDSILVTLGSVISDAGAALPPSYGYPSYLAASVDWHSGDTSGYSDSRLTQRTMLQGDSSTEY